MHSKTLTRFVGVEANPNPAGTFGRLGDWVTVEEEWQDNRPNVSCIPTGSYVCRRIQSPKFGNTFEVTGVPGRSHIVFHALNTEEDTEGCIGICKGMGVLRVKDEDSGLRVHKLAGTASRVAMKEFLDSLEGIDEFILHIVDHTGGP